MYSKKQITESTKQFYPNIKKLKFAIEDAEAVFIGAGSGLSTASGYTYDEERLDTYFPDFKEKYGITDMYSGGFYPFDTLEEYWAYWSRYVFINRYIDPSKPVYNRLFDLVKNKDYFVLTTNVDHCFQKAGFDKERLFYTQGDYGLFQCSHPCHNKTYDNEETIRKMVSEQKDMKIPSYLVPHCPVCGRPMTMNLRCDDSFVQDEGWDKAYERYASYVKEHQGKKVLYLELGVGYNTPGIIKYNFWHMTLENPYSQYVCVNKGEGLIPKDIQDRAFSIDGDIGEVITLLSE